jgi:hypothetical protein
MSNASSLEILRPALIYDALSLGAKNLERTLQRNVRGGKLA